MKIILFSDSHGHTKGMISVLERNPDIEYVIHLGDYGSDISAVNNNYPTILTESVQGNSDKEKIYPIEKVVQLVGKRIFITHGHAYNVGRNLTPILAKGHQEKADVILFGHTHVPFIERMEGILLVNPGSIYSQRIISGPTYAILEVTRENVHADIHKL